MGARLAAFVIWAAVAATAVYWAAGLLARPAPVPAHASLIRSSSALAGDLGRVLGVEAAQPAQAAAAAADPRFRLVGVVAARGERAGGVALIATDDKPARAYRVGAAVDGELVLQTVHARGAELGAPGEAAQVALELPALPPPRTGVPGAAGVAAARPAARAPVAPRSVVPQPQARAQPR